MENKATAVVSDNLSIRQTYENLQNREPIDPETLKIVNRLENTEILFNNHKKTMLNLKRKELERINKEFLVNNYERRYGVKLEDIVSVIVGEDHVKNEMERQYKDQKVKIINVRFIIVNFPCVEIMTLLG
jgi:hypothetical protein